MHDLTAIITAPDAETRNQSLDAACAKLSLSELLQQCSGLDLFRRRSENLYERVRALFFLYAIHRFYLPLCNSGARRGLVPFKGYEHLLQRRFEEAIDNFLSVQESEGPSDAISSALAAAYQRLAFQTLADQVRRSVRSVRGNQWMFRMGHPADQPLRLQPGLLQPGERDGAYPILRERTPVRMDFTHSAWSDVFFLGMDFPEGARVLNVSIDLGLHGREAAPRADNPREQFGETLTGTFDPRRHETAGNHSRFQQAEVIPGKIEHIGQRGEVGRRAQIHGGEPQKRFIEHAQPGAHRRARRRVTSV
ncbi:MAG TPA: hypothetical protein VGK40_00910, partial [Verrucomicrobiae bacterium]